MFTRTSFVFVDACILLVLIGWLVPAAVGAEASEDQDAKASSIVDKDQLSQIESTETAEALIDLGKQFVKDNQRAAAALCIEKICKTQPEMLTDGKRQSPPAWNNFWFSQRAALRLKQLDKNDAAGRAEIAKWLHEARFPGQARDMLVAALAIDKNLPAALELAKEWHLYGGPFQFDLCYALDNPIYGESLVESLQDEGQKVELRKGKTLMLIPFKYDPGDEKLTINRSHLKVTSDDGKSCSIKGIVLLEDSGGGLSGQRQLSWGPAYEAPKLLGGSEPFWERIQVESINEEGKYELICFNSTRPAAVRRTEDRSSSGRSGRSSGRSQQGISAASSDSLRNTRQGSGYAAFVVEVPDPVQFVDCMYRDGLKIHLDVELLEVLSTEQKDLSEAPREKVVDVLVQRSAAAPVAVATAAIRKLSMIRAPSGTGWRSGAEPIAADPVTLKIDRGLLSALGHNDPRIHKEVLDAIAGVETPLSEETLRMIQTWKEADILLALLDQVEACLVTLREAENKGRGVQYSSMATASVNQSVPLNLAVEALPASPNVPNIFAILSACLLSGQAKVCERALDIVLADGTRSGISALVGIASETRKALISRLKDVQDEELKTAIFRVLLIRPDPETIARLLDACQELSLTITSEDDQLLTTLSGYHSGDVAPQILDLLCRSDISAIVESNKFKNILNTLSVERKDNQAVQSAMLKLALGQFKPPYEAPIRDGQAGGRGGLASQETGFEALLATVAAESDTKTARSAAMVLVSAGRLLKLNEQLKRSRADARCQDLIQFLTEDKNLQQREALPIFIASHLTDEDPKTVQLALASLATLLKSTDPEKRWRMKLAIKQGVKSDQLVNLTAHQDERIAEQATTLLAQVAQMTSEDLEEFKLLGDKEARNGNLVELERQWAAKPVGHYACMVYIDLEPNDPGRAAHLDSTGPGAGASEPKGYIKRSTVPLASSTVGIQQAGENDIRIIADGKEIGITQDDRGGRGSGQPNQISLRIDAVPLVHAALASADAEKEALIGKVDLPLGQQQECELKYDQLGTWRADLSFSGSMGRGAGARPLRVTGAKIILEPLNR